MALMGMRLLLTLLEVIKHIYTYEKGKLESFNKSSHKSDEGKKCRGTKAMVRVPKKVCFEKHSNLCKKHGGPYTTYNTRKCPRFKKDRKERYDFCAAKKGGKKNPVNHNFTQLTKKIETLKKASKKSGKKGKKHCYKDNDSNSE
jgi:hypothetical protein